MLTSPREIKKIIKNLKNSKAPAFDNIPNILLKNLSRKALGFLTYILNSCFKLSYFPSDVPSSEFCGTATFADDTAIFASGQTPLLVQDQLQDHLNEIFDYCKDWKIKFNASKTQAIYLSRCAKNVP
jgi:Reverse transcriptase (RNA-dependent DNA polymerase)